MNWKEAVKAARENESIVTRPDFCTPLLIWDPAGLGGDGCLRKATIYGLDANVYEPSKDELKARDWTAWPTRMTLGGGVKLR